MTGKEALEYIIELVLSHTSTGRHSGKSYTQKALYKLSEELDELTKYKMAFEILKKVVIVSNLDGTYLLSVWANKLMPDPVCYLEKEQGELLEELMK